MRQDGAVACFGELLLRLSPPRAELLLQSPAFDIAYGGAEANVAVSLARLGQAARMISVAPDTAVGDAVCGELRKHGVDVSGVRRAPGRMGLYYLTPGAGPRAAEVIYDRAGSAFAAADFHALDWPALLAGAGWLHVSGITPALGAACAEAAIAALAAANALGLTASFDFNYRARLWQGREADAPAILARALGAADIAFGDHRDIGLLLGRDFSDNRQAADAAFAQFPRLQYLVNTSRIEHSANHHELSASLFGRAQTWTAPAFSLTHIVDRVGAGDAFAAGVIHALRRGRTQEDALRFGLAAAALKHVTPGDFNLATEQDVEALLVGGLSIRR